MMSNTQYNPNAELNDKLFAIGASKTVYALVTPEIEAGKAAAVGNDDSPERRAWLNQYRQAWTGKQNDYHEVFFNTWCDWTKPVIDMDRAEYPYSYPTAGASEAIRHLIYKFAAQGGKKIHVFKGEYEGYKALAEAIKQPYTKKNKIEVIEWDRADYRAVSEYFAESFTDDLFFVSQPSGIDGNVWHDFNKFIHIMPTGSVVVDVTYVGAVPESSIKERFNLNPIAITAVVFSLSKPFGAYYDRIGGVFLREEDGGLFGNMWFKNLLALRIGTIMMERHNVFYMPNIYGKWQTVLADLCSERLGYKFVPSDVFLLATSDSNHGDPMAEYLRRAGKLRLCITKGIADIIGTGEEMAVAVEYFQ
jgi:hypothetical protein